MMETLFWLSFPVWIITGIVLIIRGFVLFKNPLQSKKWFFLSGLAFLVPREIILFCFAWYFQTINMLFVSGLTAFVEIILLVIFFILSLGSTNHNSFRGFTKRNADSGQRHVD